MNNLFNNAFPFIFSPSFQALETQERLTKEADRILAIDERKRPYNSLKAFDNFKEPTEEEMEAYRMKRSRDMDPMAKFLTK